MPSALGPCSDNSRPASRRCAQTRASAVRLAPSRGSENQKEFGAEICVHFPGLKNLDKPAVMVFPRLLTCLDCGVTRFTIPEAELRCLAQDIAA